LSLELHTVSLKYGQDVIIDDVSLAFDRGTMNVLLGPTLAGKTTLMRLMAGLDKPTSGDVLVDGKSVVHVPVRSRSVAMVYQQFVNYPSTRISPRRCALQVCPRQRSRSACRKPRACSGLIRS
jgi:glycerol transport system ATP-binding protein